jgi:hypothetical protein
MSTYDSQNASEEQDRVIQIDSYGIKAKVHRSPTGVENVKTWKDVFRSLHSSLKRSLAGGGGLIEDAIEASRILMRGIAAIPGALAHKIDDAQAEAKRLERQAQQRLLANPSAPVPSVEHALQRLQTVQDVLRSKGVDLQIQIVEGRIVFRALRIEDAQLAAQIVKQLIPEHTPDVVVHSGSGKIVSSLALKSGGSFSVKSVKAFSGHSVKRKKKKS